MFLEAIDHSLPVVSAEKFRVAVVCFSSAVEDKIGMVEDRIMFFSSEFEDWWVVGKGDVDA